MIERITKLLQKNKQLFGWNIIETKKDSYQLFFIKQDLDMNREVNVTEYQITIFTKEKNKMGQVSFGIFPSMSDEEIDAKINEQIGYCKYTLNDQFNLPKYSTVKPNSKEKGFNGKSLKEAAFIVADSIFEADKYDKGYINSTEIFINNEEVRYVDSNENDFVDVSQVGQIEFVVTWADNGEEIELYKFVNFNTLDGVYIQKVANNMLVEASNRIKAVKTPALNNTKLVLPISYAKEYFWHFADLANTDMIYSHMSNAKVKDDLAKGSIKNDKMTITLEPNLKGSTKNRVFDNEGLVLKKLNIIRNDVVTNLWGSNAKSQYLGKAPNGTFRNIIVAGGSLTEDDLDDENYLEVVSLSGFEIDSVTGDFGSEIRLGYLHQKGKVTIVTGGSVSGNVNDSISTVLFSKETEQDNNYLGPKKVLLDKVRFNKGE